MKMTKILSGKVNTDCFAKMAERQQKVIYRRLALQAQP